MDAVCAPSVNFYQTKRHQIPEDSALHNQRHEEDKSLIRGDYPFIYSKELGTAGTS
jgi:hypothetical protein